MTSGQKLLITGGSGFIGAEVVQLALERGLEVLNLDLKPPRRPDHQPHWRQVDVRDRADIEPTILAFQPDILLHLASDIDVNLKTLDELKTTIDGTTNVLAAVRQLPHLRRFIHTSTQFVVRPGVVPKDERFLAPYTVYGEAKAETERLVWEAQLSAPWFIVRPTIVWGPYHPSFGREIFRHIGAGTYLHPSADAPIHRAFGYVSNVAQQIMALATIDPALADRHVYYLGDDSMDYAEWADAFAIGLTGRRAKRIPVWLLRLMGRVGDTVKAIGLQSPIDSGRAFRMSTASSIDLRPTHTLIGAPSISFENGVAETLRWLSEVHPHRRN